MKDYKVTVVCLTYNHGKYIEQTLKSFLMQKTDFAFKVLVHDDASKDDTPNIIRRYAEEYPEVIFPVLQEENQLSKGVRILDTIVMPRVDTEYMALCEGDDYWTDENKLQLQYDYMKANPECSLCVHNTDLIRADSGAYIRTLNASNEDREYTPDDVILARGGGLFHTSSFLLRTEFRREFPRELRIPYVSDYTLAVYLALSGSIHYIGKVMSAYRTGVQGSWTVRTYSDKEKTKALYDNLLAYLERLDKYTEGKYSEAIQKAYDVNSLQRMRYLGEYRKILMSRKMRKILRQRPYIEKKEIWLRGLVPFAFTIKNKLKGIKRK